MGKEEKGSVVLIKGEGGVRKGKRGMRGRMVRRVRYANRYLHTWLKVKRLEKWTDNSIKLLVEWKGADPYALAMAKSNYSFPRRS